MIALSDSTPSQRPVHRKIRVGRKEARGVPKAVGLELAVAPPTRSRSHRPGGRCRQLLSEIAGGGQGGVRKLCPIGIRITERETGVSRASANGLADFAYRFDASA